MAPCLIVRGCPAPLPLAGHKHILCFYLYLCFTILTPFHTACGVHAAFSRATLAPVRLCRQGSRGPGRTAPLTR